MIVLLLLLSMVLSTGRNLLSKNLSDAAFGTKAFFTRQQLLFICGAAALLVCGIPSWHGFSGKTVLFAAIYGGLLIFAQWFYTIALGAGNTALCSTVYSMGFILPTMFGALVWSEPFSMLDVVGVVCAVAAILCSKGAPKQNTTGGKRYFLPLVVAMLSSGGLGMMQKVQQKSDVADERTAFLVLAFLMAGIFSYLAALTVPKCKGEPLSRRAVLTAAGIGIAFGCSNLLNTTLAGLLPSAVFFPTLNIGVILLTMLCGILFYKEKIRRKECLVLTLGGLAILLLNLG